MRSGHGEWVLYGRDGHGFVGRLEYLRVGQPLGDGGLSEAAVSREGAVLAVHAHRHGAQFVALLFLLQANGEGATHGVAQAFALKREINECLVR